MPVFTCVCLRMHLLLWQEINDASTIFVFDKYPINEVQPSFYPPREAIRVTPTAVPPRLPTSKVCTFLDAGGSRETRVRSKMGVGNIDTMILICGKPVVTCFLCGLTCVFLLHVVAFSVVEVTWLSKVRWPVPLVQCWRPARDENIPSGNPYVRRSVRNIFGGDEG